MALERHDWKAAALLEVKPAWFPWNRFRNAEALVHYAKAIGRAHGGVWEAATALIAFAEGKKDEGLRLLRTAAEHEDAVDKHPMTPGALLPVREMLADLLLENRGPADALKEYEPVLNTAPQRFNAIAGADRADEEAGNKAKSREDAMQLLKNRGGCL